MSRFRFVLTSRTQDEQPIRKHEPAFVDVQLYTVHIANASDDVAGVVQPWRNVLEQRWAQPLRAKRVTASAVALCAADVHGRAAAPADHASPHRPGTRAHRESVREPRRRHRFVRQLRSAAVRVILAVKWVCDAMLTWMQVWSTGRTVGGATDGRAEPQSVRAAPAPAATEPRPAVLLDLNPPAMPRTAVLTETSAHRPPSACPRPPSECTVYI